MGVPYAVDRGMIVSHYSNPWAPVPFSTDVPEVVGDHFEYVKNYADESFNTMVQFIQNLEDLFRALAIPASDISYDYQDANISTDVRGYRPAEIDPSLLTIGDVVEPESGDIITITIPDIDIPENTLVAPVNTFSYAEPEYVSQISDAVKTELLNSLDTGGTGLGATVEDAIFQRARDRLFVEHEEKYDELETYFSSRGWSMPPGMLAGRLQESRNEYDRALEQVNYEILIEQARLAQNNTQFVLSASIQLEGITREYANQVANRALEAAKTAVEVLVAIHDSKVKTYIASLQGAEIEAGVHKIRVDMQTNVNESTIRKYESDISKYQANIQKELAIVESVAKIYALRVAGYEADAKVAAIELDAQVRAFTARVEQSKNQTELSIKEAQLALEGYLGSLSLDVESIKAGAGIAAQIAASALSGISATANMGYSVSRGQTQSVSHGATISDQTIEQHIINE